MPSIAPEGFIPIAVGIVADGGGRYLVAERPAGKPSAGKWEFPGGKIEPGESTVQALARELHEELGIELMAARPLIRIRHAYPDKRVLLDVWRVTGHRGQAYGREGQQLRWLTLEELAHVDLLQANDAIVRALRLSPLYAITATQRYGTEGMLALFRRALDAGLRLVQIREKHLAPAALVSFASRAIEMCRDYGAMVLVNADPALALQCGADGVHLDSRRLLQASARPLPPDRWVGASCHSAAELAHAASIGVDFAVLSPVNATTSHPGSRPLGWERFSRLVEPVDFPVFALGGMRPVDRDDAWAAGACGLAMISGLWEAEDIEAAVRQALGAGGPAVAAQAPGADR
jgi:8-oxo-dGTP diphosphatase